MRARFPNLPLCALLLALGAPCATALAADDAPVATAGDPDTQAKIDSWIASAPPLEAHGDTLVCPPVEQGPRKVHGEMSAGLGTGGYRSASGVVDIPVGKSSDVIVGASYGRERGYYGRYGGGIYGGPYGPLGYAPGRMAMNCRAAGGGPCVADDPCAPPSGRAAR